MSALVNNTNSNSGYVTVFARMIDGTYQGQVMNECQVGNPQCWSYSAKEIVARIQPGEQQLRNILAALTDGRLHLNSLDGIGHSYGGKTHIEF
jgi:hypothetical protein